MLFACSYAFQISGAIILLLWSWKGIKKDVFSDLYFPDSNIIIRDKNNICVFPKERLQKETKNIFLNVFAFVDLVVGYSFAIFAEKLVENNKTFTATVILAIAITAIEYLEADIISKIRYPQDVRKPFDEVIKRKPGVVIVELED